MSGGIIDRIPPQNLEAEMALLGSILVDREMMSTVAEILQPTDFYAALHETIYASLLALYERGEPLDKITLSEDLKRRGQLEKVGGLAYLTSLMDTVPTAASAEYYAQIVREKAALRGLIHAGTQITQIGYESEEDVEGAIDRSEQIVYDVGRRQLSGVFTRVGNMLKDVLDRLDYLFTQGGDRTGITSGFSDIDQYTAGFQPGNLVIIAARPGMGKTSFALTMAAKAAKIDGKPIAVFSLEMTKEELVERLLSSEAEIDSQKLRRGNVHDNEWSVLSEAMSRLAGLPLFLDDSGAITVTEIRSRCRRLQASDGLGAVIIDYLQLVRPGSLARSATRNDELSDICRTLKATAKDLQIPIIALAQLNRAVETRQDKHPMLSDLRDCLAAGALVTNCDTGERVRIADVIEGGLRFNVWAVDEKLRLARRPIVEGWKAGEKQIYRVTTGSGRTIRCSDGHRFLTASGWSLLRDLAPGRFVAVPRRYGAPHETFAHVSPGKASLIGWLLGDGHLGGNATLTVASVSEAAIATQLAEEEFDIRATLRPERGRKAQRVVMSGGSLFGAGKNALTRWLRELGIWKMTSEKKRIPGVFFGQCDEVVAGLLRGLFHANGNLHFRTGSPRIAVRMTTASEGLARDVQHLLLRCGLNATVRDDAATALWTVSFTQRDAIHRFFERIGFLGEKHASAVAALAYARHQHAVRPQPMPATDDAQALTFREELELSDASLGRREQSMAMSPAAYATPAGALEDGELNALTQADILWDRIISIEPQGVEAVYDITVGELHNFCADDVLTHNSGAIEQEADLVAFLYRHSYYHPEQDDTNMTEFAIAKHRNGRTGTVKLMFQPQFTKFVSYMESDHHSGP